MLVIISPEISSNASFTPSPVLPLVSKNFMLKSAANFFPSEASMESGSSHSSVNAGGNNRSVDALPRRGHGHQSNSQGRIMSEIGKFN